ncbi:MAG: hypothetical protein GDA44_09800 [Prochloron sp. SP5CPC1]|nr:hypothetical protein [Candidatus Paraprochloron terpiosi SP5CPC1]
MKKSIFKGSLSWQLLTGFGISLVTVGAATLGINYLLIRSDLEEQVRQRAHSITQGLIFATEGAIEIQIVQEGGYTPFILRRVVQNYANLPAIEEVAIVTPTGETLAYGKGVRQKEKGSYRLVYPELTTAMDQAASSGVEAHWQGILDGKSVLVEVFPFFSNVLFDPSVGRRGLAIVMVDLEEMERSAWQTFSTSTVTMVTGIVVILVFMGILINITVLRPLGKLNLAVEVSNEKGTFSPPSPPQNEIGFLTTTFDKVFAQAKEYEQSLLQLNAELDHRVQIRTSELLEANKELASEISERKKVEQDLREFTSKLEQSNRELQDFASVASHDLQEPLRKIQTFGDRLKAKFADGLPDKGKDYLERMQSAASRAQTLINDLLAFSRVTTKAQPFVEANLNKILQGVLSDLEVRIEETKAEIELGDLPTIEADRLQMRQLLQNLIGNALKYHREEVTPQIQIQADIYEEKVEEPDEEPMSKEMCRLTVTDNGIGFEEKYVEKIFTVFQRLHGRNTYEGTGVGLAICRKIVERHGGEITAKSTPGEGSTFIVTIPARQTTDKNT